MPHSPFYKNQAMTLIELIVVISIIAIFSIRAAPVLLNAKRNMALTIGVGHVMDSLSTARQSAITRNRPVEVRIYLGQDNNSPNDLFMLYQQSENEETYEPISTVLKLDEAITLSSNSTWSSVLQSGTTGEVSTGQYKGKYHAFRFMADGSTDLSISAEPPTFTFIYRTDVTKSVLANFFTLQLDLQTGTIRPFRPL